MTSTYTKVIAIRFTPHECMLIEGLADMRGMAASDLLRELIGLEREDEMRAAPPPLRLVAGLES